MSKWNCDENVNLNFMSKWKYDESWWKVQRRWGLWVNQKSPLGETNKVDQAYDKLKEAFEALIDTNKVEQDLVNHDVRFAKVHKLH